jgi:hypothetical protein
MNAIFPPGLVLIAWPYFFALLYLTRNIFLSQLFQAKILRSLGFELWFKKIEEQQV